VVRTFQQHFPYTLLWLTHYDAEIVGSNRPFEIDEASLEGRLAPGAVAEDLGSVMMGSARDLLGYFVMGTAGMARFAQNGTVNTDDNLYLEFSAPFSIASPAVMAANVKALTAHRESLLPYVRRADDPVARAQQERRWIAQVSAARVGDAALALFLAGRRRDPALTRRVEVLEREYPSYAPGRFLAAELRSATGVEPRLLQQAFLSLVNDTGERVFVALSAVLVPVSATRASVMFVDARSRTVYGQLYVDQYDRGPFVDRFASDVIAAARQDYDRRAAAARTSGGAYPRATEVLASIRTLIEAKVRDARQ
jgi:spermidine synthase